MDTIPQPSIFELFAQQQLKSGIREGVKYLSKVGQMKRLDYQMSGDN